MIKVIIIFIIFASILPLVYGMLIGGAWLLSFLPSWGWLIPISISFGFYGAVHYYILKSYN